MTAKVAVSWGVMLCSLNKLVYPDDDMQQILRIVGNLLPHFVALCLRILQPPDIFVLLPIGGSIFILDFKIDFCWRRCSITLHAPSSIL